MNQNGEHINKTPSKIPIRLTHRNFNEILNKSKSNNINYKKINSSFNSSVMISSLKKNLSSQKKINSKKHNENFSNYFDNIIDIFKNSLSSDQMQKSESLVNINNKNTINIMAESLIKINKNI